MTGTTRCSPEYPYMITCLYCDNKVPSKVPYANVCLKCSNNPRRQTYYLKKHELSTKGDKR